MRTIAFAAAVAALAAPATLIAQMPHGEQQARQDVAMMHVNLAGTMGQLSPTLLLSLRETLDLTDLQVARLEELQARASEECQTHASAVEPLMRQAIEALGGGEPDLERYRSALERLADAQVEMQIARLQLAERALAVLTPEQRADVHRGLRVAGGMMRGMTEQMMQGGMMQGGMMHGAMMRGTMGAGMMGMMGTFRLQVCPAMPHMGG
jgi:Spy/CpxP family protein refolding chaperone